MNITYAQIAQKKKEEKEAREAAERAAQAAATSNVLAGVDSASDDAKKVVKKLHGEPDDLRLCHEISFYRVY